MLLALRWAARLSTPSCSGEARRVPQPQQPQPKPPPPLRRCASASRHSSSAAGGRPKAGCAAVLRVGRATGAHARLARCLTVVRHRWHAQEGQVFSHGRTMVGGAAQVLVHLLLELATSAPSPLAHSHQLDAACRARVFAAAISGAGACLCSTANRTAHGCLHARGRHQWFRCGWFLDDWWDDSIVWLGRSLGYESLAFVASAVSQGPCSLRREGAAIGTPPPAGHWCRRVDPPPPLPGEVSPPAAIEECKAKVRTIANGCNLPCVQPSSYSSSSSPCGLAGGEARDSLPRDSRSPASRSGGAAHRQKLDRRVRAV